jgi:hypothetical protein
VRRNWTTVRSAVLGLVAVVASACALGIADREIIEVLGVSSDERSVELMVASCNGNPTAEVEEEGDRVLVKVRGDSTNDDCADAVCIELDRPLNGRSIIDATTGQPVPPSESLGTPTGCT